MSLIWAKSSAGEILVNGRFANARWQLQLPSIRHMFIGTLQALHLIGLIIRLGLVHYMILTSLVTILFHVIYFVITPASTYMYYRPIILFYQYKFFLKSYFSRIMSFSEIGFCRNPR